MPPITFTSSARAGTRRASFAFAAVVSAALIAASVIAVPGAAFAAADDSVAVSDGTARTEDADNVGELPGDATSDEATHVVDDAAEESSTGEIEGPASDETGTGADVPAPPSAVDASVLATSINFSTYTGGTTTTVSAGQVIEVGNTMRNQGSVGIPANTARLSFQLDKGATFVDGNVRNVGVNGTRTRVCALGGGSSSMDCIGQSNWNPIGASTTGNNFSNFYARVQIPADAVPGTRFAVTYSFDFDPAVYTNVNATTSTTWYYLVRVPAPIIDTPSSPVGPTASVTGVGVPGATLSLSTAAGEMLGTTTVGDDGAWAVTPATPFADGVVSLSASQHSVEATSATATASIVVDAVADAPTAIGPEGAVDLSEPIEISGEGEAGATIEIRDGSGTVLCTTTVGVEGTYSCVLPSLPNVDQNLSIVLTDAVGNRSETVTLPLVALVVPAPDPITDPGTDLNPVESPAPADAAATTGSSRPGALAATGSEIPWPLLGGAAAAVALGGILIVSRRRPQGDA